MIKTYVMFALATVIMMLPLTGYTMSYNQGFVDGIDHQQEVTLYKDTADMSAFVSESEADLFNDDIAGPGVFGASQDNDELAMAGGGGNTDGTGKPKSMGSSYSNPEVGWQGTL